MTTPTYYGDLGVARTATREEIRAAYRRLALKHHPDRGGRHEDMVRINIAAKVLLGDESRASYDRWLDAVAASRAGRREGGPSPSPPPVDPHARVYPSYADLDSWLDALFSAGRSTVEDVRDTRYGTATIRGVAVPVGESGSGVVFALGGGLAALVFLSPLWSLLPVVLGPIAVAIGMGIGTAAHWIVRLPTLDPDERRLAWRRLWPEPEATEPQSPEQRREDDCKMAGILIGGALGTLCCPCVGTLFGVWLGFNVAEQYVILKRL